MIRALDPRMTPWIGVAVSAVTISLAWGAGVRPFAAAARKAAVQAEALSSQIAAVEVMVLAAGGESAWRQRYEERLRLLGHKPQTVMPIRRFRPSSVPR